MSLAIKGTLWSKECSLCVHSHTIVSQHQSEVNNMNGEMRCMDVKFGPQNDCDHSVLPNIIRSGRIHDQMGNDESNLGVFSGSAFPREHWFCELPNTSGETAHTHPIISPLYTYLLHNLQVINTSGQIGEPGEGG
ncbi:hypothetical protein VNO77_24517 [Canavalia gladiata]|uniref:Uncharacterized protein n=1 Tax=Canavalia gladiata TaxID=3824 RepID=A0AAN9L6F4_CANGL